MSVHFGLIRTMRKILAVLTAVVIARFASISLAGGVNAETNGKTYKIKTYSVSEAPIFIPGAVEGVGVGTAIHRSGFGYRTLAQARAEQKPQERWHTVALTVDEDLQRQVDHRSTTGHTVFNDGSSITYLGITEVDLGKVPVLGQRHTFVIVGGTGKFFGAQGTMTTKLVDTEKLIFATTFRLIKQ